MVYDARDIPLRLRRPRLERAAGEPRGEAAQHRERLDGKPAGDQDLLPNLTHPLYHAVIPVVGLAYLEAVDGPHDYRGEGAAERVRK